MKNKNAELRLGRIGAHAAAGFLNVLLQLLDGVFECGSGIVHLVNDEDALADEVFEGTESREIEPLSTSNLSARLLNLVVAKRLVKREANGLDGDVGRAGLLEEGPQDSSRNITAAADGDHELGLEIGEEPDRRLLAEIVNLKRAEAASACGSSLFWWKIATVTRCQQVTNDGKHLARRRSLDYPLARLS